MKRYNWFLLFLMFQLGYAQQLEEISGGALHQKLSISDFSYPLFLNDEEHGSFVVAYQISDKTHIELQGFYDTYRLSNRFRTAAIFKRYLTKRLYMFGGVKAEFADYKGFMPQLPPRLSSVIGFGYDVISGFSVEGKFDSQLNNSTIGVNGEPLTPMPQVYSLGGKFKF